MAGDTVTTTQNDYVVLARKYRSRTFAELIGQEALVRTLTNAIAMNKIHHAYVLTGIRGTGKTSTARLLAMALNCENGPSVTWDVNDAQVEAIRTGRHVDVFEYDAASNRSVEDVQRLFEGVNYAPVAGRYKVYIIDEVHMLSTTAFNALLKTLEEPPPQVKFIFATTDVQKIPLTVLSRCQRFDLKRIPSDVLGPYFQEILTKEGVEYEPSAVQLIARAADGSARDGLSLLDQSIALSVAEGDSTPRVTLATVEGMLGVADRSRVVDLLEALTGGRTAEALAVVDNLYASGSDAMGAVQGMMEIVHLMTRIRLVSDLKTNGSLTELERVRVLPLAEKLPLPNMGRLYQLLAQALVELKVAERPYEALAMACVRMAYLSPLPALDKLVSEASGMVVQAIPQGQVQAGMSAGAMAVSRPEPVRDLPVIEAGMVGNEKQIQEEAVHEQFADWVGIVRALRADNPMLTSSLERQVRCVSFEGTKLELAVDRGLLSAADLLRDLRTALKLRTGVAWDVREVQAEAGDGLTIAQMAAQAEAQRKSDVANDPMVSGVMGMFPGAELEHVDGAGEDDVYH
ncbi:MAG: DNA polymerase III subunit gamma/tau [Blastochloris viridis]|uniref:DNA polymerase III subunit gamma/tau n=1 Tax=Blastochloris viridis TaxID=1079 RepID=A0A6N4RCE1_BLAVI|nr:MAG: DNA polymerase III subunit gamma/tau [Blastochloris viridis]